MRHPPLDSRRRQRLLATALLWLGAGTALLASTLVPAHTALLGWAPLVWLVATPLALLLIVEPQLPRELALAWRPQRRAPRWR
ncbi:MAG: hypothetical protein EPN56_11695 [Rhodanobacter sp.]|nr:MAG: hypothetical protein EPN78_04165 [Rhodanobacter sp.]TAM14234.1 MAG: hypothetical protein EPN66_02575 [Rhodanobacter sp.]TAM34840.1 MAG: hypothetical protein EPN56_11695 [Rhodanobacter sp.]